MNADLLVRKLREKSRRTCDADGCSGIEKEDIRYLFHVRSVLVVDNHRVNLWVFCPVVANTMRVLAA
jgi:hypothetical protein